MPQLRIHQRLQLIIGLRQWTEAGPRGLAFSCPQPAQGRHSRPTIGRNRPPSHDRQEAPARGRAAHGRRASPTKTCGGRLGLDLRPIADLSAFCAAAGTADRDSRAWSESRTASVGFVTIMGRPMATSQDFVNWVCGPDLDPEFLMHLFIRSRERFRSLSAGAVHKTVYFPTAMALRVCVPPIEEQRRIAARLLEQLAEIDRPSAALEAQRFAIEAMPAALLREVFGEVSAA